MIAEEFASSETSSVGLGIDWTFLNFGIVRARIDAADARAREALARYEQAVLTALEDTETRLVRYEQSQQRTRRLQRAVEEAEQAVRLARIRHDRGFTGYFEVISAEQALIAARDEAVRSRTAEVLAMVSVYRALAGPPPADGRILGIGYAKTARGGVVLHALRAPLLTRLRARPARSSRAPQSGCVSTWFLIRAPDESGSRRLPATSLD